ncbi:MAG: 4Fe-4S dicluster domain-containing protein [Candidatus Altiarchaeota archaeon]
MTHMQMAKNTIKALFSRPSTLMYPKKPAKKKDITRGRLENDIAKCVFCGMCQRICPADAITVERPNKSWEVDRYRCVVCGACVGVCPVKSLRMDTDYTKPSSTKELKDRLHYEPPQKTADIGGKNNPA